MLQQLLSSRKSIISVLVGIILLTLVALTWRIVVLQKAASKATPEEVLKIGYCGAEPDELCVLSFGRDVDENMVVNIFSPNRKFPAFYLKIKRATGDGMYECEKDKEVRTNVFCYGDMANLQEKMEVSLIASEDDKLLAVGNFTLRALLISEPSIAESSNDTSVRESAVNETPTFAESFSSNAPAKTPTPTLTPDASYPNPSYP